MNNEVIAHNFSLLGKLMDIHGENPFKTKSYSGAAFTIDKLSVELSHLSEEEIHRIPGVGDAIAKKIMTQLQTGMLPLLNEYIEKTPPGVVEMLNIKGLGAKKIATIWKELGVESLGELLYACNENRLLHYKGFGEKTQQNIKDSIEFYMRSKGSFLYSEIYRAADALEKDIQKAFSGNITSVTGDIRQQREIIEKIELVTTVGNDKLSSFLQDKGFAETESGDAFSVYKNADNISLYVYYTSQNDFYKTLFITSSSEEFIEVWQKQFPFENSYQNTEEIFTKAGIDFIPSYLREEAVVIEQAKEKHLPKVVEVADIAAIIHSHSTWSDGADKIADMAKAAKNQGLQYLVLSDHSRSAFYASGLSVERLTEQHKEIDELNKTLAPFKIFKSIESDILNDGNLDYTNDVLATFDVVIASVHSNLKMSEEKAMKRLLTAIENPYTNILGHMTGRLLLSRSGYPVNHTTIIDACAANNVVIELNANPHRLDIDWRYLRYAMDKGVLTSINPDAHSVNGFSDVQYGILVAQKAGVTKEQNLSSFSLPQFEAFLADQRKKR